MKIQYTSSALVLMLLSSAQAAIINVPGDQPDIQSAINVAVNGDEIIVAPGRYFETIDFLGKAITPRSTDPSDPLVVLSTIIDANGGGSVVTCNSGEGLNSVLSGFVIIGGSGTVFGFATVGGGMYIVNSSPTVMHCLFSGNTSSIGGGGIFIDNSSPSMANCSFIGNSSGFGGGILNTSSSNPTITECTFRGNTASRGGGVYNEGNSKPTVTNSIFGGNLASSFGGGMYSEGNSNLTITNCLFVENSTTGSLSKGGGMYLISSFMKMANCTFSGNMAIIGGGMYINSSSPSVTNCLFSGNSAINAGGGISCFSSNPAITNCSFNGNSAGILGGGLHNSSGMPKLTSCILWGDSPNEIVIFSGSTTVSYSNVQGGFTGLGNIDADPFFTDPLGPDGTVGTGDEDLSLTIGSPCIDAGNNSVVPVGVTTDLDGNPRFLDDPGTPDTGAGSAPLVDMGAYEFDSSCLADTSGDDQVNVTDLLELLGAWGSCPAPCPPDNTGDGQVNVTDLLSLLALWGVCP